MVFIGGLHRSGTTHLAHLLGQHPDASVMANTGVMMDEGQYLQDVYPQDWRLGGPGCFAYSPEAHRTEQFSAGRTTEMQQSLMRQWEPYWDLARPVLIEKTPGNCLNARFLQSLFDNCYFVFITRHPAAVSLATRKWSRTSMFSLMEHWLAAHEIMRQDVPHLRHVIWISYERLVADPAAIVSEIQDFLGMRAVALTPVPTEDFNPGYFRTWRTHYLAGLGRTPSLNMQNGVRVSPSRARRAIWAVRTQGRRLLLLRRGLDLLSAAHEGQAILARHEARVREHGYSLLDLAVHPAASCVHNQVLDEVARPGVD
jgi:hypothetical protein